MREYYANGQELNEGFAGDIVIIFKDQRTRGTQQFAILIITPNFQVTLKKTPPFTVTDNSSPTYPPDDALGDYIVARPHRSHHAEALLMGRFPTLLALNTPGCQSIVLYSWFLPCQCCAEEIARVLGQQTISCSYCVTVVYTTIIKNTSEEEERYNTFLMKRAGITVIKIKHRFLPPA